MKLKIIDTSALLHSGNAMFSKFGVGPKDNTLQLPYSFPTGGMYGVLSLFKQKGFLKYNNDDRIIFCFDRPSFRKKISPTYKSNRPRNPGLLLQSMELEKGLNAMGFATVSYENYEADDMIAALVEENYNKYNQIEIYGTDRDLAALVDHKVSLISTNKNVPSITINNFTDKVIPGIKLPYNTMYLFKLVFGDTSDTIEPLMPLNEKTFNAFLMTVSKLKAKGINGSDLNKVEALDAFINATTNPTAKQKLLISKELILPKKPANVILTPEERPLNEVAMITFLSTFKMKSIAKVFNIIFDDTIGYDYIKQLNTKLREKYSDNNVSRNITTTTSADNVSTDDFDIINLI